MAVTGETLTATIEAPTHRELLPAGELVLLQGQAEGVGEPGRLEGSWWSSLDGALGTVIPDASGAMTLSTPLSAGEHHLTLTVAAPTATATDAVDVTVGPEDPPDEDPPDEEPPEDVVASGEVALVMSYSCVDPTMIGDIANAYTELDAVDAAVTDLGLTLDVYWEDPTGLSATVDLTGYVLVMETGCGYGWQDYATRTAVALGEARDVGAALLLFGDDASYADGHPEVEALLITEPALSNGGGGLVSIGTDTAAPVDGAWGVATGFSYRHDIDTVAVPGDGERVLATLGSAATPVWIVREDPVSGQRSAMLIAGIASSDHGTVGDPADLDSLGVIFRNTVAWAVGL